MTITDAAQMLADDLRLIARRRAWPDERANSYTRTQALRIADNGEFQRLPAHPSGQWAKPHNYKFRISDVLADDWEVVSQ